MAEMVLTCPYCASARMTFDFIGQHLSERELRIWKTFWVCRNCEEGVVVNLSGPDRFSPGDCRGDPRDGGFYMHAIRPEPQRILAPACVPDDIARDFKEATDNLRRKNWTSSGMMFRKVLQRSTSRLVPEDSGLKDMRLVQRIDALDERRLITPAMKDLAHRIRLDGNEATHEEDEEFSEQQAKWMKDFTELFLIYAFTLPARIEASNTATESEA